VSSFDGEHSASHSPFTSLAYIRYPALLRHQKSDLRSRRCRRTSGFQPVADRRRRWC